MESNKISVLVQSGHREQLQMASMIASVGAVSGNAVMVFLSMNALAYFIKGDRQEAPADGPMGGLMARKNAPDFMTLFEQAVTLGDARIHPCSMAMDIMEVGAADLEPFVGEAMGLTNFLDESRDAQVWSF